MSSYVSKKAIRYKIKKKLSDEERDKLWDYRFDDEKTLKQDYNLNYDMEFDVSMNEDYLDIVLKKTYDTICGDFGISRELTQEEIDKYLPDFQKISTDIKSNDLRYVFYCYYNGTDAPNCFDEGEWCCD